MDIRALTELLLKEQVTVAELAAAVGRVVEQQRRRWRLLPADPRFREGWLGIDPKAERGAPPLYLELWTSAGAGVRVAELNEIFGRWERVPPPPEGNPFIVEYRYDQPRLPRVAFIYVALTGEPDDVRTQVERITIRREPRL
jgi:hypothetical protein